MLQTYGIILVGITMLQISMTTTVHQFSHLFSHQVQHLTDNDSILVELSSPHNYPEPNIASNYYLIRIVHKEKKEAYNRLKDMFQKTTNILIHNKAIPNQQSFAKSKISPTYLSKKRSWSFSTVFILLGSEKELEKYYRKLHGLKIQRLNKAPSVSIPSSKIESLVFFNKAKQALLKQLQRYPYLQIQEVYQFEGSSKKYQQSENQNNSSPSISEDETNTIQNQYQKPKIAKVIFKIGKVSRNEDCEEQSQGEQQDQEDEYSNQSEESKVSF